MNTQNPVVFCMRKYFNETFSLIHATGPSERRKIELTRLVEYPGILELFFGLSDTGGLRPGITNARNIVILDNRMMSGHTLHAHNTLFGGLVGQHRPVHKITDSIDARHSSPVLGIHNHPALFIAGDTKVFQTQSGCQWFAPHSHQHAVTINFLTAATVVKLDDRFSADPAYPGDTSSQFKLDTLLAPPAVESISRLTIHGRQDARQH